MSQSVVGVDIKEPVAQGWAFVARGELAFDPYSGLLANAPQAMQDAIHVPLNQQELPVDSSRWGWLAGQIYAGLSSPVWGTLTFGRQNALETDGVNAYDPMGGSYAFSPIGFSGFTCGAGDTEECRWTTAIKYRVNFGNFRFAAMGQPWTGTSAYNAYNPNNGAIQGDIGGDFHLGPGLLSVDAIGSYVANAVNIGPAGGSASVLGVPVAPFAPTTFLSATLSNNTAFMALAKYAFGSWGNQPIVTKGPVPPPSGIPLTLYAGYEWLQLSNPSNAVTTSFPDDGFMFNSVSATGVHHRPVGMAPRSPTTHSIPSAEPAPAAVTRSPRLSGPASNTASPETWISSGPTTNTSRTNTSTAGHLRQSHRSLPMRRHRDMCLRRPRLAVPAEMGRLHGHVLLSG